jgi:hypothetical protein
MEEIRKVLYIGNNKSFISKLSQFFTKMFNVDLIDIKQNTHGKFSFSEELAEFHPNLVFLDFSVVPDNYSEGLLKEIKLINKFSFFSDIMFIAIVPKRSDHEDYNFLISYGIHYIYKKIDEIEIAFTDICYIGLNDPVTFEQFATARLKEIDFKANYISSLTEINNKTFKVETDSLIVNNIIKTTLPFFEKLERLEFDIIETFVDVPNYNYLYNYLVKIPVRNPLIISEENDEIDAAVLSEWLKENEPIFSEYTGSFLAITNSPRIFRGEILDKFSDELLVRFIYSDKSHDLRAIFKNQNPDIIYYEEDAEDEESITLKEIIKTISALPGFKPIVIVLNKHSKTSALQKAYLYKKLMAMPDEINGDILKAILSKFYSKKDMNKAVTKTMHSNCSERILKVSIDIKVTSFSEHEFTFVCSKEIPMFTVLEIPTPTPFLITIIPPIRELLYSPRGTHYMGLIHGVNDENLQSIRQLIYKYIKNPISLTQELYPIEDEEETPTLMSDQELIEMKKTLEDSIVSTKRYEVKRKKPKGKTKLK